MQYIKGWAKVRPGSGGGQVVSLFGRAFARRKRSGTKARWDCALVPTVPEGPHSDTTCPPSLPGLCFGGRWEKGVVLLLRNVLGRISGFWRLLGVGRAGGWCVG